MATKKMVRCVHNEKKDPSPFVRPPRRVVPPSPKATPMSSSPSSNPLYAPDDELEDNPEGKNEASGLKDNQGEEDKHENEQASDIASCDELQDAQSDDESLEILGGVDKTAPTETPVSREKGKVVLTEPTSKEAQLKRPSHSEHLEYKKKINCQPRGSRGH